MSSHLIERLTAECGYPLLNERNLGAFLAGGGHSVLFFTEDPTRYPESNDVAVILPELMRAFGDRCRAGVIERDAEKCLQQRYGFAAWPALVLLRGDAYLGAVTRVQDWADYLAEFERLFAAAPSRPPGIGVPLVEAPAGGCH